ncbi:helix-turn-helix domain-containing protein [Enterococcus hirae]|uniref:helix-turn-helix domain-containing protein n=1 Tax=Enterococcus hirae TaxID=1354 RepID=UPI00104176B0|nr:helix-turn-helix domain-containing protein [Enterococcus hirae]
MIEQLLLDDHSRGKLAVYGQLLTLSPGEHLIDNLRENLETTISMVKLKKILVSIQEDLEKISNKQLLTAKNKLIIRERMIHYNQYQNFLTTQSIPYQLLLSIIKKQDEDLASFCQRNYISRSTCFRQTKKLAQYFKDYHITLNLTNLTLTGSEILIRIMFFNFFWFVSLGESLDDLYFSDDLKALFELYEAEHLKDKYAIGKKQAMLHCKINLLRIKEGHFTDIYELTPTSFIPSGTDLEFFYDFFQLANLKLDILEINSLFYLFYYWPFLNSKSDVQLPIVEHSYLQANNHLKKVLEEFETHCQKYISNFNFHEEPSLHANIYLSLLNFTVFKQKIPLTTFFISTYIQKKYPMIQILATKIESYWKKIANRKNFLWLKNCSSELAFIQACLLYPYYTKLEEDYKLKVGFINVSEYLITYEIFNLGEKIPFIEIEKAHLPLTKQYDFYIIGSPLLIPPELDPAKYAVIDFCRYNDFETALYQRLSHAHHEKLKKQL